MSEQDENKITATFLSEKENKIKWHHSRWFWGVVVGLFLAWGLFFYFFDLYSPNRTEYWMFIDISIAFGAIPVIFLAPDFLNFTNSKFITIISLVVYYVLMITLLYNTFNKNGVRLLFPVIFISIFLFGTLSAFSLSGF